MTDLTISADRIDGNSLVTDGLTATSIHADVITAHFPANPDKFEFDKDVTAIFPNMAERSIPNYRAFHKLHAEIVGRWFSDKSDCSILDVGASHGAFFEALIEFFRDDPEQLRGIEMHAIDNSEAMCKVMRGKFPDANIANMSVTSEDFMNVPDHRFDVVNCTYVVQFVHPSQQFDVLRKLSRLVKPGGVLILGQKEAHEGMLGLMLHEQYIRWRESNGYTREEIEAKNRALKNSMWPMRRDHLHEVLHQHFREVAETTRTFMFNTLICFK